MGERTSYEPGIFSWAELATTDLAAARRFYGDLFGWDYEDRPISDNAVAGAAGEQAGAAGGSVHVPPTEVPAGRFSVVADPQGAVFALFEGPLDP